MSFSTKTKSKISEYYFMSLDLNKINHAITRCSEGWNS